MEMFNWDKLAGVTTDGPNLLSVTEENETEDGDLSLAVRWLSLGQAGHDVPELR